MASCGTSGSLHGFLVPWGQHGNIIPLFLTKKSLPASGCLASGSGQVYFAVVCLCLGILKSPRAQLSSGLRYLLGAINTIRIEEKRVWEEALAAPALRRSASAAGCVASSQLHGTGGFCREEEETSALVPDDAKRSQIFSHRCGLYNPSDAPSYLQLLPTGF